MDRPLGPRQPDKRHAAYEDIFGRPGASHHTLQNYPQPGHPYPYPYHQQLQPVQDKRTSYSSLSSYQAPRQSHYPQHPHHAPPSYTLAPPNQHPGRPRSVMNNPHINGVILSRSDDPPNPSLESLTPSGLTPAQAYQAQIYLDHPQADWNRYQNVPGPSNRSSFPHPHNGGPLDPPRLGVSLDHNDGRLGLDFAGAVDTGGSGKSSPQDTDDGSSELPWVRVESAGAIFVSCSIPVPNCHPSKPQISV